MIIDKPYVSEDALLKLLADEEHSALGLDLEYRSGNAIQSMHRIDSSLVTTLPGEAETAKGEEAQGRVAAKDAHTEQSHSPDIGESGLHELIEFASLAKVMG